MKDSDLFIFFFISNTIPVKFWVDQIKKLLLKLQRNIKPSSFTFSKYFGLILASFRLKPYFIFQEFVVKTDEILNIKDIFSLNFW